MLGVEREEGLLPTPEAFIRYLDIAVLLSFQLDQHPQNSWSAYRYWKYCSGKWSAEVLLMRELVPGWDILPDQQS